MSVHLVLKQQQQSDSSLNWIQNWDTLTFTWLEEEEDCTMMHTQSLPDQLTLKMLTGCFHGIFWILSTSQ